jgi:hypothetical protein
MPKHRKAENGTPVWILTMSGNEDILGVTVSGE